ncbi:MAG: hypothetical protein RL722_820 [Pseudomonadota bacterium]|jgi:hypothetical protein
MTADHQNQDATGSDAVLAFVQRWQGVTASELATAQSFVIDLCELLGVARPHPTPEQDYMFERPITFVHGDGSTSAGRIDCYKRGHFVLESKKIRDGERQAAAGHRGFGEALQRAHRQAQEYARALPAGEGRPPFVVVVDVGHVIELYAEFSRSGATYTAYPDGRSHRITLGQLADPKVRDRLRRLWTDPLSLDPSRASAKVTREVSAELADLAKSLEAAGHQAQHVAGFLTRCLFSMFAEDIGLLPTTGGEGQGSFVHLLATYREQPDTLANMLRVFWDGMDRGGFNAAIAKDVLRFNGKLFKGAGETGYVLPLSPAHIDGLLRAAKANWKEVEPAIFGTLLERALSPTERHALGAHYTPRAYVERLVLPTVIEPLRADWANAQAAAWVLAREADTLDGKKREAKLDEARTEIRRFHHQLCTTRVLDPACGSGNFLYVTLEHLKRLEGEVLDQLDQLGDSQFKLGLEGETVTLRQLLGIEINERAAAVAELVLWIGWLQWHVRTRGLGSVAEPVVHDYRNIECRDAVLAYDRMEIATDEAGKPLTRWDGITTKPHPVTGEQVPDESAQTVQWRYINPRPAEWPAADFIVGNPPFIGNKRMREALGHGYVDALRSSWPEVPESADFVMYWWNKAALLTGKGSCRQFGLITTNSITMIFNRRIIELHQSSRSPVSLVFAVPDHPWVDAADGAAVRIAMTTARAGNSDGVLWTVKDESETGNGEVEVRAEVLKGRVHPNLKVGAAIASARRLVANDLLSNRGVIPHGAGFIVSQPEAKMLGLGRIPELAAHIRPYRNGRDLTDRPRDAMVIDLHGLEIADVRAQFPEVYQWLAARVKPERDTNNRARVRDLWWLFAEPRKVMRATLHNLQRFVATGQVAKHRVFQFLDGSILPDDKLIAIAIDDAKWHGVLSSCVHVAWAIAAGGTLEDRPVYSKSTCFETFPFPGEDTGLTPALSERIRVLTEELDAHRKSRQAAHEAVTLTGMYNVLEKLRKGEALNAKEKAMHELALVSVLQSLHDELDAAVLEAYGWKDLGPVPWADEAAKAVWTESLLERLVALNAKRAAEEAAGTIRWLRPEFQDPARRGNATAQPATAAHPNAQELEITSADVTVGKADEAGDEEEALALPSPGGAGKPAAGKQAWPADLPAQVKAVAEVLQASPAPLTEAALADRFTGRGPWKKRLPQILSTLEAVGRARASQEGWRG